MATTTTSYGSITITEVQEGSQIWTTTVSPSFPSYTFTVSNLIGDSNASVKVGDIIMYSYYRYSVLSVSTDGTTVFAGNRQGFASTVYQLIVSPVTVIKDKNGVYSPYYVTLMAKSKTGTNTMGNYQGRFKIETTTDNENWETQYTSTLNESTVELDFSELDDIVALRCSLYASGGTSTLLDQQVISVVTDGVDGNDAYTVILTNENHTFAGNTTSAIASEIECNVIAYKGTTQVAATIGTITGQPTGMTTALLNNGTTNSAFRVSVTGDMTTRNGTLNIPLTIDGKSFTKKFTYSLALNGKPLFKVELDNYYSAIPVDSDGKTISDCSVGIHFVGRKGEDAVATSLVKSSGGEYPKLFGISPQVINSTISHDSSMNATAVAIGYILYIIPKDTVITNNKGNINFKFNLDGASHNLEYNYCWSKVTQGKDGGRWYSGTSITGTSTTATVFSGSGISSAVEGDMYLNTSTYNTYRCTLGGDASTAKWVYVNNIKGVHGDTGKGVSSIVNQYYLSTSNTTQTGGSWSSTVPPYVEDCYYWTKSHIVWTDNTETDTTAVLDNGLTDANANAIDARKVATNYLSADNTGIMVADMEDGEQTPSTATGKNVFIDNDSVDVRNGQTVLSSFGNNAIIIGQYGKSRLMLSPTMISGISDVGYKNFNIISGDSSEEETITKNGNFENDSSETGVFNGSVKFSERFYYFHKITATVVFNYIWDGEQQTTDPLTLDIDDPVEDETGNVWLINGSEEKSSYVIEYGISCSIQHNGEMTYVYFDTDAQLTPKNTSIPVSYEIESTAPYSIVIETKVYKNTSYTFGSRTRKSEQGNNSFTIGEQLIASSDNQVAIGTLNNDDPNKNYAFMVGNGVYDENHREHRSNAFAVDCDGNTEVMGNLEINNNQIVTNNSTVGGNETITGNLTVSGTITDTSSNYSLIKNLNVGTFKLSTRTPVYRKRFYWTAEIGANSSWFRVGTNASLDGYTPVGVVSFGCFNASSGASSNVDWCVITKCYVWATTLDVYVWNQNTGASARCGVYVDVLYFAIGMT